MEEKPNYYAIIPADVRYDKDLKAIEKLLYGEITTLTYQTGECWASNNYFAKLYNIYPTTISKYINHLKDKGYIQIRMNYVGNSKEIEKRIICIAQTDNTSCSNKQGGYSQTSKGGIAQTSKENNTRINNTSINNKKENIKRKKYFDDEELNDLFYEFLDLRVKLKAKNTERAITLLINELKKWNDNVKKQMINNSIMNSWKSVYPIKNQNIEPEWLGKEYVKEINEEAEEVERRFLEELEKSKENQN